MTQRHGFQMRAGLRGMAVAAGAVGVVVLAGCTLGPDPERPASIAEQTEGYANASATQPASEVEIDRWWRQFDDPVINRLVQRTIERNTNLREAAARVVEARAALGVATGQRLPAASAGFSRNRQQTTFDFGGGRDSAITTTYTLDANISWQVDLFGRLRRQQDAAGYRLLASKANRAGVLHSIVSQAVRLRTMIATFKRRLAIARNRTESFEQTLELIQLRAKENLVNDLAVRAAKENLAQSRARIPDLRYELQAVKHALDVLLARPPGTGPSLPETLPTLPPSDVPRTGVPAGLLDRRPDLRNTAMRARAEQAEIGVAIARLYPDLTLSAGGGYEATDLGNLLDRQGQIWTFLIDAAMPLFQGGAGWANIDQAEARARAVAAEYAGAVLDAMQEVEDALARQQTARRRYEHLQRQVKEARRSAKLARQRYDQGLVNLLDALEIQRRRFAAETTLVEAQQTLWDARIDLYLALGGDWVESSATPPATQPATPQSSQAKAQEQTQPKTRTANQSTYTPQARLNSAAANTPSSAS